MRQYKLWVLSTTIIITLMSLVILGRGNVTQGSVTFYSPFPTPLPPPTSILPSLEAQRARTYISEREGIPVESLLIITDYEQSFPFINHTFQSVLILDTRTHTGQAFAVLVDLVDGRIETDVDQIIKAERAAYQAKFGKLHPSLYERLQEIEADDLLPVAIWVAGSDEMRTRQEVYLELASRYPEAVSALNRDGVPWAVDDADLAKKIQQEYRQMRIADTVLLQTELEKSLL